MCSKTVREKAIAYEALVEFFAGDEEKAWNTLLAIDTDYSDSFISYASEFAIGEDEGRFGEIWRKVRDDFDKERIPYTILTEEDPLFPKGSGIHFLYAAGDISLLELHRIVFLGTVIPTIQGRGDLCSAVHEAVSMGAAVAAPFDPGLGAYALSVAIDEGGKAIAVLPSGLSKCPSESLLELMGQVFEKGLLLSQFSPHVKREKWHIVLRNKFLSSFSGSYLLIEDKDGGPSWPVVDGALKNGRKVMVTSAAAENEGYTWVRDRLGKGCLIYSRPRDMRLLYPEYHPQKVKREKKVDLTPDLFDGLY